MQLLQNSIWEKLDSMEQLILKLGHIKAIARIIAEDISSDDESSACWAISDMASDLEDKLIKNNTQLMSMFNEMVETIDKLQAQLEKKGGKK